MATMPAVIEGTNLEKTYADGTRALRGVTLAIHTGEFVAIMGPSGSGKSTLLHIFGLLDDATSGIYRFDRREVSTYTKYELAHLRNRKMGFIFQTFNLLSRTSAFDNVKLPLMYSTIPETEWDTRAENVLATVGLSHRKDHDPSELSGGERQRVAIARALITNPSIIFADEPTGNLDSQSGDTIMTILEMLHKEGRTVILITHERSLAERTQRIVTIKDGCVDSDNRIRAR